MAYQSHRDEIATKHFADYKDTRYLRQFMNTHAKVVSSKRSGISSKHQRAVALAIKRARFMGLLPYLAS